ncbi:tRNA-dihydrouridine synthase [Thalassotalea euphylliae]|uniref:tRNA-dihydrouridine synthase n=1 Tax=Thalassotalea euphylliae TaxID=1655234 RepID=UPI003628FC7C
MEGVVDHIMRELLTELNDYDICITEFVRVVKGKVPKATFFKIAPELRHDSKTKSGTKVRVQLLGQHPQWLAENAIRAIELGSHGVDLNFGCPAKTVNKSRGGAVLLKDPELMYQVISQVVAALKPLNQEVSAKIRLGFDDVTLLDEIIDAVSQASPDMLTVHARTKKQGYKPPAYWEYIKTINAKLDIPVVANGEIWTLQDAQTCMDRSGSDHIMLGRGALATPNLCNVIKRNDTPFNWLQTCLCIKHWLLLDDGSFKEFYFSSRLKQWYRYLKVTYPESQHLFNEIKTLESKNQILKAINLHL